VAANLVEARKPLGSEQYDVLLTGLDMAGVSDGLTVVSAMRHVSPTTVTVLLGSFSQMGAAAQAIHSQTEDILVKPMEISTLTDAIMAGYHPPRHPGGSRYCWILSGSPGG
jgi:YesN/AraC family two-component response regulator